MLLSQNREFLYEFLHPADAGAINPNGIKHLQLMVEAHFSLKVNQFSVTAQEVYQKIYLIVLF